jgi:hypothetical protein
VISSRCFCQAIAPIIGSLAWLEKASERKYQWTQKNVIDLCSEAFQVYIDVGLLKGMLHCEHENKLTAS